MTNPKIKIVPVGGEGGYGGLYNVLFGDGNEIHRVHLVAITVGLETADLGRTRDAWVERDEEHGARYALYTRNGGQNRPDYVPQIFKMQANEHYLSDRDDAFDNTYATFYFRVPERLPEDATEEQQAEWTGLRATLIQEAVEPVNMDELWQAAIKKMEDPKYAEALLERSGLGQQLREAFDIQEPEEGKE